jgi:SAM-dependent methyltransferase
MKGYADKVEVQHAMAHIYNCAVAASALSAAWEIGALDELDSRGGLEVREFAARRGLAVMPTIGLFRALAAVHIVNRHGTKVVPGKHFATANRNRSFFHWLTRGSAELFRRMPEILAEKNRIGEFYHRDAAAVAFACREINEFCYDPWFWEAVRGLDFDVRVIADLGCGSGERVIQLLRRYPEARAIGVDVAVPALAVAKAEAADAGVADRVTFLTADVLALPERSEFAEVDLITCFMMGHDLWPRQQCVETLRRLRTVFPRARRILLGDATRTAGVADDDLPVFTLAFELGHDLMGTFIPTVLDWESALGESGWTVRSKHWINIAVGEVVFELEPS